MCAYNAPVFLDIKCPWDLYITASFVYAKAFSEEQSLVVSTESTSITLSDQVDNVQHFCYDYEPAFTVGLGWNFGCDHWYLYAEYFRYHNDVGSGSFKDTKDTKVPSPAYFPYRLLNTINSIDISGKWRLDLDVLDVSIGRKYYVGKCLTVATNVGLRASWLDQKTTVNGTGTQQNVNVTIYDSVVNKNKGVGPRFGIDTDWSFCGCFRFFGNWSTSLLVKSISFSGELKSTQTDTGAILFNNKSSNNKDILTLATNHSMILGFGWGDYWCCNDWYFDLSAAYEFRVYWNQNVLPQVNIGAFDPTGLYGDLYLHGLVITARLDF